MALIGVNGGLLGSQRTTTIATAPGLWTPNEQVLLRRNRSWPLSGDPYFGYNSLLLHMDGSNGSTTFTDSSLNALTVTANGDAKISTAQSKFGGASAYFDGTGDYLTLPSSTIYDLGASYTIEFWVYPASTPNYNFGLAHRGSYSTATSNWTGLAFSIRCLGSAGSGNLRFYFYATTNANEQVINTTGSLTANTWTHIAMTRSGTTGYAFVNGALAGTITSLNTPAASSEALRIARWDYNAGNEDFNGYIDDLRITKGVARYTANFTPPTGAFLDVGTGGDLFYPSTSLLLHMDGSNGSTTFTDSSSNALAVTANGNAQVSTAQSKFGGASAAFDGTGDYLSAAASTLFDVLSGDSTVEFWFKHNNPSDTLGSSIVCVGQSSGYWQIIIRSGQILLNSSPNGSTFNNYSASQTLDTGWHHFAWTKQASTHRLFYDGVLLTATGTAPTSTSSNALYIGANYNGGTSSFNGYIDDLRITKGVARYTANFTPPIAPFPDA